MEKPNIQGTSLPKLEAEGGCFLQTVIRYGILGLSLLYYSGIIFGIIGSTGNEKNSKNNQWFERLPALSPDPLVELSAHYHMTSMAVSSRESKSGHSSVSSDSMVTSPANNCDSSSSCAGLHLILCLHLMNISHLEIF